MWSQEQIADHTKAAELINAVKDITLDHIRTKKNISEYEVQQFIIKRFEEFGLESDKDPPIVAFNRNSATPEFYPKVESERLKPDTFILIDIWAKLKKEGAPFADITWVAYYGNKIPPEIERVFNIAVRARSDALEYIKSKINRNLLPSGKDIDSIVRRVISDEGFEKNILHDTGHSLGIVEDHGEKPNGIYKGNSSEIMKNVGYTIEPGIYLKDKFGVRIEMDFYVNDKFELIITTPIQKEIVKI